MSETRKRDMEKGIDIEKHMIKENNSILGEIGTSLSSIKIKSQMMKDKLILSNQTTEEIGSTYETAIGLVVLTISKFKDVLTSQTGLFIYMVLFIIIVFIYLYSITK